MSEEKIIIDLNDPLLQEGQFYTAFSKQVNQLLLSLMHAGIEIPMSLRGTDAQIESFFDALKRERR